MTKYIVLEAIFRMIDTSYTEGFICINKDTNEIVKCKFALDNVLIKLENNKLNFIISEYDPDDDSYVLPIVFTSMYNVDYLESPSCYQLTSNESPCMAELEIMHVVKDYNVLSRVLNEFY